MSVLPQLERELIEAAERRLPPGSSAAAPQRAARHRRPSIGRLVPLVTVAVAIAVAVIALGSLRAPRSSSPPVKAPAVTPYPMVSHLLDGIPQSGTRLGRGGAPVRVTFYGDLECQVCRRFVVSPGFARFVSSDVRHGMAQITFRSLCTSTCNNANAQLFDVQQAAAYAAGRQGRFWQYALLFYLEQRPDTSNYVTRRYLTRLADQIPGLNLKLWQQARRSSALREQVGREPARATAAGVFGTPTLEIRGRRARLTLATVPTSTLLREGILAAGRGCPKHWRALGFAHCRDLI